MGGRGASSGISQMSSIIKAVRKMDFYNDKYNPYSGEKLLNSPTFVETVKDAISKQAFNRGYEITQKELDEASKKIILEIKPNGAHLKGRKTKKQPDKPEDAAVKYFREHYNPNREKREITSSTYIRTQNRLNDDVNTWFGRGVKRKKRKK